MITPWQLGDPLYDDLHTVPTNPGDRYTIPGPHCSHLLLYIDYGFPDDQFRAERAAVIAHEVGHAVGLEHSFLCNSSMMYYRIGDTLNSATPFVPVQFTPDEKNGVRLWQ